MDNEKVKQFILVQRQKGISDDKIASFLQSKGVNLSQSITPEPNRTFAEKVAGFTGGDTIAKGLGQVIANKFVAPALESAQNSNINIQTQLLSKIKEKKALGEDTTRLEGALKDLTSSIQTTGNETGQLLNQDNITGKQLAGDALQLATTLTSAGALKGATTGALKGTEGVVKTVLSPTTFKEGLKTGAKAGLKAGAAYGTSSGVSGALKEDKSLGDVAMSGVTGGLTGAASGAVIGGLIGGVAGKIKGSATAKAQKKEDFVLDYISPKVDEKSIIQARMKGNFIEPTLSSPGKIKPDKYTKELARVTKDIISPKFKPQQNIDLILEKVSNTNEGVKAYVSANKVPFNTKQLTTQLNKGRKELNLIFASDKQAEKTYNAVVKEFIKHVEKMDTRGLLAARQEFDNVPAIKKLIESQALGENTKKEIVKQVRTSANEYIASLLPKANKYREDLLNQSKMIDASLNIATKNTGQEGRNLVQYTVKKYPWLKAAAYFGLGAVGASVGIGALGAATGKGE